EQMATDGVESMCLAHALVGFQTDQDVQRGPWPMDSGHGNSAVEGDHWPGRGGFEAVVKREDLPPVRVLVARGFVVHRRDRRLQLVWTATRFAERFRKQSHTFVDLPAVP